MIKMKAMCMLLILYLITVISAHVRQTTYEQYTYSDITTFLSFQIGMQTDYRATDRSCAMTCSMHNSCYFFKTVPDIAYCLAMDQWLVCTWRMTLMTRIYFTAKLAVSESEYIICV